MLILQIESPSPYFQGDQVYRTFQPCFALAEHGDACVIAGTWLSPLIQEAVYTADVVVMCQVAWYDFLTVVEARKRAGLATIFEINDNFLALQSWNPAAGFYGDPSNRALTLQLAHDADGLLLCSPGLIRRFAHLNRAYCVLPNHLWEVPRPAPRPDGPICIGWAGSGGHREDIRWVAPVLCEILQRHPQVTCAIMGQTEVHAMFKTAPQERLQLLLPGSLEAYQQFLGRLDIGIAPLLPTGFNQCRSDVKYLEYAAAGAVPVCSRAEPYAQTVVHGSNGMLFDGLQELRSTLETLIENATLRQKLRANALHYVQTERQERQHAASRYQFYRSRLQAPPSSLETAQKKVATLFKKHPTPSYRPHARFWQVRLDQAEACLLDVTMATGDDERTLEKKMAKALALAPQAYLPHIYYGRHHHNYHRGITALQRAMALNPDSCLAPFMLGQRHLSFGAAHLALEAFKKTIAIADNFAPAHEALARLAFDAGRSEDGVAHLQAALRANPFYRSPAMYLARMHLEKNALEEASHLLQQTIAAGDPTWRDYFLLADVHQRRRAWAKACEALEAARVLAPEQDVLRARLAQLYLLQGKASAARHILQARPTS